MYDMFLFHGHGEGDGGAEGNGYTELDLARQLTNRCLSLLRDRGVNVYTNDGQNNYNRNLTRDKRFSYNMGATIHLNSAIALAEGTEIIVPINENFLKIESEILEGFKKIGFTSRGLKSREYVNEAFYKREHNSALGGKDWYKEIREAWQGGNSLSIIECCFINNSQDVNRFLSSMQEIAIAIVNPYLKEMGKPIYESATPKPPTPSSNELYKVQVGAFSNKANADKLCVELKAKGYNPFITKGVK